MAFRFASLNRPLSLSLGLSACVTTALVGHKLLLRPSRAVMYPSIFSHCSTSPAPISPSDWSYTRNSKTPLRQNGQWNPNAIRQISTGSILGLVGGLTVSVFSKPLALLIGLLIAGVQFIESRGIHIVPYSRIQNYFGSVNVRSAVQDNIALKISFGLTFALAGFSKF